VHGFIISTLNNPFKRKRSVPGIFHGTDLAEQKFIISLPKMRLGGGSNYLISTGMKF